MRTHNSSPVWIGLLALLAALEGCGPQNENPASPWSPLQEAVIHPSDPCAVRLPAPPSDRPGIAVAFVLDTSGSMTEPVPDGTGKRRRKIDLAREATEAMLARLARFQASSDPRARAVQASLATFHLGQPEQVLPMGPFELDRFRRRLARLETPAGSTPLGTAMALGLRALHAAGADEESLVVITDGKNTAGADQCEIMERWERIPPPRPSVYLVAFQVDAAVFQCVKDQGGLVLSATDGPGLQQALDAILTEILAEEEESPAPPGDR